MIIYSIPFLDEEGHVLVHDVVLEKEKSLADVLRDFLKNIGHGYIDDNFDEFPLNELLQIGVEHYKIHSINITEFNENQKPKLGRFSLKQHYRQKVHFEKCLDYIKSHDEIILSSHICYEGEVESDHVQFLYNGVEMFLFFYYTTEEEDWDIDSNSDLYDEYVIPFYETNDEIQIDKPLNSNNQIIDIFKDWAKQIRLDITDKKIRMANEEDYIKRPFFENLEDTINQDPEHKFSIPSELIFFDKEDIPPFDELVTALLKETPETIGCVIEDFKDDTILKILEALNESLSQQVIEILPLIPCQTLSEKKRFIRLFSYNKKFAENRIDFLQNKYNGDIESLVMKKHKKHCEEDDVAEYLSWKDYLSSIESL